MIKIAGFPHCKILYRATQNSESGWSCVIKFYPVGRRMCVRMRKGQAESMVQTRLKSSQGDGRRDAVQQMQKISDKPDPNDAQLTGI